jgi:hypothetical protein
MMKRLLAVWMTCSALSLGSFGVLVYEDRRLGVSLPYSAPLAMIAMAVLAPAAVALLEWVRGRRPIVVQAEPIVKPRPAAAAAADPPRFRRRGAEGVVLLDASSFPSRVRAA